MARTIGILGAGSIGANAARLIVKAGVGVAIANARGPAALAPLIAELGETARATSPADAVAIAEIVLLAVPWPARHDAIASAGGPTAFAGKIVIDAMNPYGPGFSVVQLPRRSSEIVAEEVGPGARLVKAFNTLAARYLADGARQPGAADRIAIPISGDDHDAKAEVARLIDEMGFDVLDMGSLAASRAQEPDQALYGTHDALVEMRRLAATLHSADAPA